MESKLSFMMDYARNDLSFSELCRRHQISRTNGYKWLRGYESNGLEGLKERSRRPKTSPRISSAEVESQVFSIREEHILRGVDVRSVKCSKMMGIPERFQQRARLLIFCDVTTFSREGHSRRCR
jgi:transposase-like protein